MVKFFITHLNGVITGSHTGDFYVDFFGTPYYGHERIEVPEEAYMSIRVFDKTDFYDKDWRRKSDCCLIDEGLLEMPEGYIREGNELRLMTQEERIIAGLDDPPIGYKVEKGKIVEMSPVEKINAGVESLPQGYKIEDGEIIEMTPQEKIAAGVMTQEEYNSQLEAQNIAELNNRLAELQTPEVLAQAELDEEYAEERREKLAALLAVKQQPGFPLIVEWS